MGNVGAAFTNFGAPFIMLALGWHGLAKTYAIIMFVTAILFYLLAKDDPNLVARRKKKKNLVVFYSSYNLLKNFRFGDSLYIIFSFLEVL